MAPSFDSAVSSLLCAEDNSIFDDNDYGAVEEEFEVTWHHRDHRNHHQDLGFGGADALPSQSDECLASMVEKESQHLPAADYLKRLRTGDLDLGARRQTVEWIVKGFYPKLLSGLDKSRVGCPALEVLQIAKHRVELYGSSVHAHFSFGPLCAYLAVNYLDRFLSAYELPKTKPWTMQLLAVSCLSLAAKVEETDVPLSLDLQVGEAKYVFEARTIQRMELLVLSTLRWRMQAVTPFSFIDYFLCKINGEQTPIRTSISRSIQLILCTIKGIDFLEFRPSEVAAAVAIAVAGENQTLDTETATSFVMQHVQKERVLKCVNMIHDLLLIKGSVKDNTASTPSVPQSPIGVLDAACLSYKSDEVTVGSCPNSSENSPDAKRRKLNGTFEVEL